MNITIQISDYDTGTSLVALADALKTFGQSVHGISLNESRTLDLAPASSETTATSESAQSEQAPAQTEKPKRRQQPKAEPEQSPPETPEQPAQDDGPIPNPEQQPKDDVPTVVELRAKAQEVGKTSEAKQAIKALLDKFGSKSISDVPEDKRADFLAELDLV